MYEYTGSGECSVTWARWAWRGLLAGRSLGGQGAGEHVVLDLLVDAGAALVVGRVDGALPVRSRPESSWEARASDHS